MISITKQLQELDLSPKTYLETAKQYARSHGYDPSLLKLATTAPYKLAYDGIPFGRTPYADFIIYTMSDPDQAEDRRKRYLARASKMPGNWKDDKLSRNMLAMNILWNA